MKKILLTAFAVLGLMTATTSCDDFLDEEVRGQENLDTYFQNAEDAESFVVGCYNSISDYQWWTAERMWILCDMCTDDYWMGNTGQNQEEYISLAHYMGVGQSNGSISDFWQYRYKGILKCNIALDRIPGVPMDENFKNRLMAEARFLRGYFYFELVKNFGGVPLVTGFLMPSDVTGITRSSIDACYDFIEEDFDFASKNLPARSELNSSEIGRATSGAALGLLGKSQVYAGRFEKAKTTLKKLIDTNEYDLMPDFGQNWNLLYENNRDDLIDMSDERTAAIVRAYIQNLQFTYGEYSLAMARFIQSNYVKTGRRSRGVKPQLLRVLYATDMPGVLTEIGFLSNPKEAVYLKSEAGQDEIARSLFVS